MCRGATRLNPTMLRRVTPLVRGGPAHAVHAGISPCSAAVCPWPRIARPASTAATTPSEVSASTTYSTNTTYRGTVVPPVLPGPVPPCVGSRLSRSTAAGRGNAAPRPPCAWPPHRSNRSARWQDAGVAGQLRERTEQQAAMAAELCRRAEAAGWERGAGYSHPSGSADALAAPPASAGRERVATVRRGWGWRWADRPRARRQQSASDPDTGGRSGGRSRCGRRSTRSAR